MYMYLHISVYMHILCKLQYIAGSKRLETIFDEHQVSHVHYLSIDVEGAEFEVIQSINFDKVFIDVIAFENNYHDKSIPIIKYLEEHDYVVIHRSIDIFMIHKKSKSKIHNS